MATSANMNVTQNFPHPTLPPLTERPTYESIAELHLMLNANAASLPSTRGDGIHGLLILTVSDAVYLTTTGMAFIPPTNPGIHPQLNNTTTAAQIAHANREHAARVK